uniref:Putative HNH endonuclease n=1 Tax=viral metagenome TaxID=1070528 RepID=A0A6M3J3X2_9ZZZZ
MKKIRPPMSEKTRDKIRKARTGMKHSEETLSKMRESAKKAMTEERRKKMSDIAKKRMANRTKEQKYQVSLKLSAKLQGKNSVNWEGGKSSLENRVKRNFRHKLWRESVLKRDNFACRLCGYKDKKNHAHHIIKLKTIINENLLKIESYNFDIPALWDINNGKTYCLTCHRIIIHPQIKNQSIKKIAINLIKIIPENILPEEIKVQVIKFKKIMVLLDII